MCPYCDGSGCSECDGTGRKIRTVIDAGDGVTVSVSGSVSLPPESQAALIEIARIALAASQGSGESKAGVS